MQIKSKIVPREFKSDDRPDLYAGTAPLEVLKALISTAANHKETFTITCINVSRAYFHTEETCAGAIAGGGQSGRRCWKNWTVEEEHARHTRHCEQLGV